jgi:signal transduction histidine kinase
LDHALPAPPKIGPQAAKLTLGVWAFVFVLFLMPALAAKGTLPRAEIIPFIFFEVLVGLALSWPLYWVASHLKLANTGTKVVIVGGSICAVALLFSLFDAWLGGFIVKLFMGAHKVGDEVLEMTVSNFISFSWLYGMLGAIYVILVTNAAVRERDLQLVEARSLAQTAQLTALRLQLNPHFLFNTLNAISTLIVTGRSGQGEQMLSKLCDFLRNALTADTTSTTPLGEELATIQTYLEIEAIRFGDRLSVQFVAPDELMETPVPSFVLQPLVENAIKYGVAPTSDPVIIRVTADASDGVLHLNVEDNGTHALEGRADKPSGTGVGLSNVRRRLEVLYGGKARLETMAHAGGFLAKIRLPLNERPALTLVA